MNLYQRIKNGDLFFHQVRQSKTLAPSEVAMVYEAVKDDAYTLMLFIEELSVEEAIALRDYQAQKARTEERHFDVV